MIRGLVDAIGLFALPFVIYGVAVVLQRRFRLLGPQWTTGRLALLSIAGLVLVAAGLFFFGLLAPRHGGVYVPAHIDDGRLVPGELK